MHIFIMRHGEAELTQQNDSARRLTEHGISQAEKTGVWLAKQVDNLDVAIDCALVSPYTRAKQTFDSVSRHLSTGKVISCPDIVPSGNVHLVQDYVEYLGNENPEMKSILVVSHMPFVSYFLDKLLTVPLSKIFATASVAYIDYDISTSKGTLISDYMPD